MSDVGVDVDVIEVDWPDRNCVLPGACANDGRIWRLTPQHTATCGCSNDHGRDVRKRYGRNRRGWVGCGLTHYVCTAHIVNALDAIREPA